MIDVAIVGGGPAGLLTAARLARAGLDITLLEEHSRIGEPTHCTGIVSLETAKLVAIPDDLVLNRLSHARLVAPSGGAAHHHWPTTGDDTILAIDRGAFDQSLASQARGAGATIRVDTRVRDVEVAKEYVTLHTGGRPVRARTCVLACGVSYRFQRQLGLGLPGQAVHTAQTEIDATPSELVELHFGRQVAPNGFVWKVPVVRNGRHRLKIGVMAMGDAGAFLNTFLERATTAGPSGTQSAPVIRRLLPLRPIAKTYTDRILVVGDAGGFTKPTTGGGIFYSLLTASLAADTLEEAFAAGRFDDALLARYEDRWQERLGAELRVADWLRQFVTKCSDGEIELLVAALDSNDLQELIQRTARFNWHRDVIVALVRQPQIARLIFRTLFR